MELQINYYIIIVAKMGIVAKKQKITIQNIILISKLNIYEMRKMNNTF